MADDADDAKTEQGPDGVFGNLPAARPGSRSPRRRSASGTSKGAEKRASTAGRMRPSKAAKRSAPAASQAKARERSRPAPVAEAREPTGAKTATREEAGLPGVEDLAWAGVTVAAQAATAGVRFASRALEAARKSIDRP